MDIPLSLYTGKLTYKGIKFAFAFSGDELRLVPQNTKQKQKIRFKWQMSEIREGVYTFSDPTPVQDAFLIGVCNETMRRIVFYPVPGSCLSYHMDVICIPIFAYVTCRFDRESIDRVCFTCTEINYIHPVQNVISKQFDHQRFAQTGEADISIQAYNHTTSEEQSFIIDGKTVKTYFGIWRQIGGKNNEPPLSARSSLFFEFDTTSDFGFIIRLWQVAKTFVSYLCYRTNIDISSIQLDAPYPEGKHEHFATVHFIEHDSNSEVNPLNAGRYISQALIAGSEGRILTDISADQLYIRHLPKSYHDGRSIDAARFVMLTAAFEWEFQKQYPNGVVKSKATIAAEEKVKEEIQQCIDNNTGKKKSVYKHLLGAIDYGSFQSEIIQIGKDYGEIITPFGTHLYKSNHAELDYSKMGERLGKQRNAFAHGDLDKDFIGLSLLDLIFLEMIIYAMQLRYFGIEDLLIKHAINNLFKQNMLITE